LRKSDRIRESALEPVLTGSEKYSSLVVGWGSNFPVIKEALEEAEAVDTSFLHIRQVYPMHPRTAEYLEKAERIIVVENNATSQLGSLLMLETGIEPDESILKYDGHPFSVEELADHFRSGHKADVS
jgi:2-oxoglutarate ferredoxin oxidoreductase subunit alpha